MSDAANRTLPVLGMTVGLAALALVAGLAVWGWAAHGETIFMQLLQDGLRTCL